MYDNPKPTMKKRGDLVLKNTLGILIAIAGIAMLALAIFAVISNLSNQEIKNVRNLADDLVAKSELVSEGESILFDRAGFPNSNMWQIVGFNQEDEFIPAKCFDDNCLCVCKDEGWNVGDVGLVYNVGKERTYVADTGYTYAFYYPDLERRARMCQETGVCKRIEDHEVLAQTNMQVLNNDESLARVEEYKRIIMPQNLARFEISIRENILSFVTQLSMPKDQPSGFGLPTE